MNVGAHKPSDYGLYFQWGDTVGYTADQVGTGEGKKYFFTDDCKFFDGVKFTKYNTPGATLELEDDAAHVNMGGDWHMPTPEQIDELINTANTTNTWTTQDGVSGMTFTSKKDNSKSIFIPAAGSVERGETLVDSVGEIWANRVNDSFMDYSSNAQYLQVSSDSINLWYGLNLNRDVGRSVRGVIG